MNSHGPHQRYKLSSAPGFCFFKHVLLVSSPQDRYVPISSALLHSCHKAESERGMSLVYKEMVQNLLGQFFSLQFVMMVEM